MTLKEKTKAIIYLLLYGIGAYLLCKVFKHNPLQAMRFEIILCAPYFWTFYGSARKISSDVHAMSILELFAWCLHQTTVGNLMLPLLSLSLAIGNVLANFSIINVWQGLGIVFASAIVVVLSCLAGTIIGYLNARLWP